MSSNPASSMPTAYDPADVEQRVYESWLSNGYFTPVIKEGQEPFTVIMPPPNVTGELHLGHALEKAILTPAEHIPSETKVKLELIIGKYI